MEEGEVDTLKQELEEQQATLCAHAFTGGHRGVSE